MSAETDRTGGPVNCHSPPAAKIALSCSLFQGRDDVYPRRFESRKTGKSGHSPPLRQRVGSWPGRPAIPDEPAAMASP